MRQLFDPANAPEAAKTTNVLSLSSVVGPAAKGAAEEDAAPPAMPGPSAKPSDRKSDPPKEVGPLSVDTEPKALALQRPPEVETKQKPEPAAEPKQKPEAGEPKPERKPARAKAGPEADDKKRAQEAARLARKPVGRKDLKPGASMLVRLSSAGRKKSVGRAVVVIAAFGMLGGLAGMLKERVGSREAIFRAMETAGRETPRADKARLITIMIDSEPRGAAVWLDKSRLAETTPLAVERPYDDKPHELELSLDGRSERSRFKLEAGPITVVKGQLGPANPRGESPKTRRNPAHSETERTPSKRRSGVVAENDGPS
jgi:hypothetical protein